MHHCYFLINYIVPPKVFFLSFGPLFKKFAHHCTKLSIFCISAIKLKNATTGKIGKIITQLKNKNSCGCDEVSAKILKIASLFIVSPLTYICNGMLTTGTFPDRLKYSEIKPIYKKGDKTQFQTIDQSHYFQYFLKSLKKFHIRDYTIT